MKSTFSYFYKPSDAELKKLWANCIFVFDTNTLLNLYKYSVKTRDSWFDVLRKTNERVFLPYQVGHEYHSRRMKVIFDEKANHKDIIKSSESSLNQINTSLEGVKGVKEAIEHFKKSSDSFMSQLNKTLNEYPDYTVNDPIIDFLNIFYNEKTGKEYSDEKLIEIFSEGKKRYVEMRPPGYKDEEKKKNMPEIYKYGDLIIWKQILDFSVEKQKSIIFITDDNTEDWWIKRENRTLGPHHELIKEFKNYTGQDYYQYSSTSFLKLAQSFLSVKIEKEMIDETIIVQDKNYNFIIQEQTKKKFLDDDINLLTWREVRHNLTHGRESDIIITKEDWQKHIKNLYKQEMELPSNTKKKKINTVWTSEDLDAFSRLITKKNESDDEN